MNAASAAVPGLLLDDEVSGSQADRLWQTSALRELREEELSEPETPLRRLELSGDDGIDVYVKVESAHPTGSLKHRLARSLFTHALQNGWIGPTTTIVEASSGSTAVSEAWFAQRLGLPFTAVVPSGTTATKLERIKELGGNYHLVDDPAGLAVAARGLADVTGGHFMDQFTYAEQATAWKREGLASAIFDQLADERYPVPRWLVVGAGTGGTATALGRAIRHRGLETRLCVVDPEGSAFFNSWMGLPLDRDGRGSRIEGIGRPTHEASFLPTVVDRMMRVPDAASVAAMECFTNWTGIDAGPSTGTSFVGILHLMCEMRAAGQSGSLVTLVCDSGARYAATYCNDEWLQQQGIHLARRDELRREIADRLASW